MSKTMFLPPSPFARLRTLLAGTEPGDEPLDLSLGGPKHPPPRFIMEAIAQASSSFGAYPPIGGTALFQRAAMGYVDRRFSLHGWFKENGALLPTSGSKEGLFFAALTARDWLGKANPAVLFANPFYHAYPAATHALGAEAVPLAAARTGAVPPDWSTVDAATLDRAIAYYVASPSNPQGFCATLDDWHGLIDRALAHDFFIFADECYTDLYREAHGPPPGILEAVRERPEALARVLFFHSLSKRSNLPGMRVGVVAGAPDVIAAMEDFRNQAAPQVPGPLQTAAAAVYDEDTHVAHNRRLYDEKFAMADDLLGPLVGAVSPPAGFFLWLPVDGDDEAATLALWREAGVKGLPGRYLALTTPGAQNPGRGHVRLALVADHAATRDALSRVKVLAERGVLRVDHAFEGAGRGAG